MSDPKMTSPGAGLAQESAPDWNEALAEPAPAPAPKLPAAKTAADGPAVASAKPLDLDFILDIPLEVSVEVGRTKMLINDLLQLNQGSVIELGKLVGEPFEVLINNKLVARGEVVVVNERFGVRLTDIISPMERIEQLK
ncbi:MAG: flagellar motor switch protein FliN [Candidatus Sumerlaeota bacterium]|nr:flagellar motor switch protein FliN [Candidatus Sumerlaeota bacterium]